MRLPMQNLTEIKTRPVEQPDGGIHNVVPTCGEICFVAPWSGMTMNECPHYRILFFVRDKELKEFCAKCSTRQTA